MADYGPPSPPSGYIPTRQHLARQVAFYCGNALRGGVVHPDATDAARQEAACAVLGIAFSILLDEAVLSDRQEITTAELADLRVHLADIAKAIS